jgi:putative hydrolase of the HAD superfamily
MLGESQLFLDYEKGLITDSQFRMDAKKFLGLSCDDQTFDAAWNEMLVGIPKPRIDLLHALRKDYNIYLLSNTNNIHLTCFDAKVRQVNEGRPLDDCFHKAYYSHLLKMRKPDAEIFNYVLQKNNLDPQQTIFLDDNLSNLEGAQQCQIKTFHVHYPDLIFTLFQ